MLDADRHDEGWPALSALLDEALELPDDERARWIESLPAEHDALRPRLRHLLSAAGAVDTNTFLQTIPKVDLSDGHAAAGAEDGDHDAPPRFAGPYGIIRKLSEGGMGTVWLARRTDTMVNRLVALKLPRGGWWSAGLAERMAGEREILAALTHPNIARLYDAGVTGDGQPFLALEYVDGQPIDEYAAANRLSIRARLQLFVQVARAVAHAHGRLIVYRDLKPSNILVTGDGEVKLLDFGIARLLDEEGHGGGTVTQATGRHFTPDYASPEQITGERLGIATDVYSSGVLLYELLTGARPYTLRASSRGALERAILETDPRRPSDAAEGSARRALRGDLDTIVLKALKKQPEARYATMNAFAEDIERHLHSQPVLARPDSVWYRLAKGLARNKVAVATAASILAAILTGTAVATWQARVALTEKAQAQEVRDFLITLFRDASPYNTRGQAPSPRDWLKQVRSRIDNRLEHRPALRVELLNMIGASLLMLQDTDGAEEVLARALAESSRQLGADHPHTLRARVLMLHAYRFRGRTNDFRDEFARLLPVLRAGGSSLAEDLVMALKNQAHLELDAGRYEAAEHAAQEAVDIAAGALGGQHPEAVASLLTRAYVYQYSRTSEVALPVTEQAYRAIVAAYPDAPTHPRRIEGRLLYGRALGEAGQPARAVEQLAQAVADATAVFGPASRMVGFFLLPLAESQAETGEIADAIANSQTAIDIIGQHTREQSFRYAAAIHHRGVALLAARRVDEALPDLVRASETLRQALPPGHEVSRWFDADRAIALARAGRHAEAGERAAALLPAGPPADSSANRAFYVMGLTRRLAGDAGEALRYQRLALQYATRGRMVELRRMRTLTEIGFALLDLSRPQDAVDSFDQALAISRRAQTHASPDRADILVGLARAHLGRGRPAVARDLLIEANAFWREFDPVSSGAKEAARWLARSEAMASL